MSWLDEIVLRQTVEEARRRMAAGDSLEQAAAHVCVRGRWREKVMQALIDTSLTDEGSPPEVPSSKDAK